MFINFLRAIVIALGKFFLPPLPDTQPAKISPKTPCVGCGHKGSTLRAVTVKQGQIDITAIRQTCDVCGAGYDHVPLIRRTNQTAIVVAAVDPVYAPLRGLTNYGR